MSGSADQKPPVPGSPGPSGSGTDFAERLTVPWWWWPIGVGIAALLAAEIHLGQPGLRAWLPYVLTPVPTIAALLWLGRHRVAVHDGELRVGVARLPLRYVGAVTVIPSAGKRKAMGPELDPAAFVAHRPWIGPMVRVVLDDPADPTPYWLFSVRRAAELGTLLRQRAGGTTAPDRS